MFDSVYYLSRCAANNSLTKTKSRTIVILGTQPPLTSLTSHATEHFEVSLNRTHKVQAQNVL